MVAFSVLLPTRDRLDLLRGAIETVRRQDFADWEIVVADNCSSDDVGAHVRQLDDPRIVFVRSDVPLSVTDNWNRALDASRGDYVIMLGDDDGLVPGYFERVLAAMRELDGPDLLYHGGYIFAFPGAHPAHPMGALTDVTPYHGILCNCPRVSILPKAAAESAVHAALRLRAEYGFNMQYFLFSRRLLQRLAGYGRVFRGPFPDFFAANMALLLAERIGRIAEPLVLIGISPKSYGFYHFNDLERQGTAFLQIEQELADAPEALRDRLLPGSSMNTSWLVSVVPIPALLGRPELEVDESRYRRLQILECLRLQAKGSKEFGLGLLWPRLNWSERAFAVAVLAVLSPALVLPKGIARRWSDLADTMKRQYLRPRHPPAPLVGRYRGMVDVFEGLRQAAAGTPERVVPL